MKCFFPALLMLVLASCNPFGQYPGPDRMYERLAQNGGQWHISNLYYQHQRADGSTITDSAFTEPGDLLLDINFRDNRAPISGQLPVPRTQWVNGQPEASLLLHRFSSAAYRHKKGINFIDVKIGRDSCFYAQLVIHWQDDQHFTGSLTDDVNRKSISFEASTP